MTSLTGRRVVVTRSVQQSASLVELLQARGAHVVALPLIEVVAEPDDAATLAALDLASFDWVVVTSPNGADALHHAHAGPIAPRVAAVGAHTAARLVRCDLVPVQQRATGLLAALAERQPDPARIMVVQAVDAAPTLVDGLRSAGHHVVALSPYRSRAVVPDPALLADAVAADAVLFASGSAGRAWVQATAGRTPPPPGQPVVVAIGPQTASDLRAAGLKVEVVAADHDAVGMVRALEQWFGMAE
jgi:uroporphyrinogen-III synthase